MKIAVITDIHGNYAALEAVLADAAGEGVDEIISLGDNIGYGPEPEKVTQALIDHKISSTLGNHEFALANQRYFSRLNEPARLSLEINISLLSPRYLDFLGNLPPVILRHGARFVHGCPPKSTVAYLFDPHEGMLLKLFGAFDEEVCFYGHTHAWDFFESDGTTVVRQEISPGRYDLLPGKRYLINPGSVGQARDCFDNNAKYLIWDVSGKNVRFKTVPYDVRDTVNKIKKLGFPDFNWERLLLTYK